MDNTKIERIHTSLETISGLMTHLDGVSRMSSENITPGSHINVKLDMFNDNLESVIDNLSDIITDVGNNTCSLSAETKQIYKSRAQIQSICTELFPIIFGHILSKNISEQESHVLHDVHEGPSGPFYF